LNLNGKILAKYPALFESITWETHWGPDGIPYQTMTGPVYMQADVNFVATSVGNSEIKVRGTAQSSGFNGKFEATVAAPNLGAGVVDYWAAQLVADTPLTASKVDFYDPLTIKWEYSPPGENEWLDAGTTECPVYVSLQPPETSDLYHTVVHLACSQGNATTEADALAATWGQFAGPANVKAWDGQTKLYYYKPQGNPSLDLSGLLSTHDGECGAWAEFLIASLNVNGISANKILVAKGAGLWNDLFGWSFGDGTWFAVGAATLTPEANPTDVPPFTNSIAQSTDNVGQNTHPPNLFRFNKHWIVRPVMSGAIYYDPSYGKTYSDSTEFSNSVISGWAHSGNDVDWATPSALPDYHVNFWDPWLH
jgi:hypothetical protein